MNTSRIIYYSLTLLVLQILAGTLTTWAPEDLSSPASDLLEYGIFTLISIFAYLKLATVQINSPYLHGFLIAGLNLIFLIALHWIIFESTVAISRNFWLDSVLTILCVIVGIKIGTWLRNKKHDEYLRSKH